MRTTSTVLKPRSVAALTLVAAVALTSVVSQRVQAAGDTGGPVYIARAFEFPDALAGSVLAAMNGGVLLLVRAPNEGDSVPDETIAELERRKPSAIFILGGTAAVSDEVAAQLAKYTTGKVERIDGPTRFGTAEAIAQLMPDKVADADRLDGLSSEDLATAGHGHPEHADLADRLDDLESGHVSCPGRSFFPASSTMAYGTLDDSRYGATGSYDCALMLPAGSRVTEVRFHVVDAWADGRVQHCSVLSTTGDGTVRTETTAGGTDWSNEHSRVTLTASDEWVVEADRAYWFTCYLDASSSDGGAGLAIVAARATYR